MGAGKATGQEQDGVGGQVHVLEHEVGDDADPMGAGHVARVGHRDQVGAHASAEQDVGDGQGFDRFKAIGQHNGDGRVGGKVLGSGHGSSFLGQSQRVYTQVSAAAPTPGMSHGLDARGPRPRPTHSERSASTGSWREARAAGMIPAMTVRPTETATRATAVSGESWAMFSTLNEE